MPLLFAYGINRFSHDVAHVVWGFGQCKKGNMYIHACTHMKENKTGSWSKFSVLGFLYNQKHHLLVFYRVTLGFIF